jgi:hypothetical protein
VTATSRTALTCGEAVPTERFVAEIFFKITKKTCDFFLRTAGLVVDGTSVERESRTTLRGDLVSLLTGRDLATALSRLRRRTSSINRDAAFSGRTQLAALVTLFIDGFVRSYPRATG